MTAGRRHAVRPGSPRAGRARVLAALLCIAAPWPADALPRSPAPETALPRIGPAPGFTLTSQEGNRVSLRDLRGTVTVVAFIFAGCSDTCPLLTAKLAGIQRQLGAGAAEVRFAAITVDPLNDTPAVLKRYAMAQGLDARRFTLLTGTFQEIDAVVRSYAVYRRQPAAGRIDHAFLTSIIDRDGTLRVQYLGVRFDPQEFLRDLASLVGEKR